MWVGLGVGVRAWSGEVVGVGCGYESVLCCVERDVGLGKIYPRPWQVTQRTPFRDVVDRT